MADVLRVWHGERLVGALHRRSGGGMAFEYASSWLESDAGFAISVSLPCGSGLNTNLAAQAFFANLLPEGGVREAVARQLGLSSSNDFALLEAIGGECAGALSILPASISPDPAAGRYEPLPAEVIADMARRHSVLAEVTRRRAPRLSLAGAQDKLPVKLDADGAFWLPTGGAPSTHILKVPSRDFRHLPANEVVVTRLARALSLVTVEAELLELDGVEVALVRRYDRVARGQRVVRLHQEDLCQASGLMPGTKYEQEGGPSFSDAMALVRGWSTDPLVDARQLLHWLVFGLLAGNADGHGKNLSLVYGEGGARLSPFYDLVCTQAYPAIDRLLAMSVGGERDPGQVGRLHWEAQSSAIGVGQRLILQLVEQLATTMPGLFDAVAQEHIPAHGESSIVQRIGQAIQKQCRRTLQLLR